MPPEYISEGDDLPLWEAWADAGHVDCGAWGFDGHVLTCVCGTDIPLAAAGLI